MAHRRYNRAYSGRNKAKKTNKQTKKQKKKNNLETNQQQQKGRSVFPGPSPNPILPLTLTTLPLAALKVQSNMPPIQMSLILALNKPCYRQHAIHPINNFPRALCESHDVHAYTTH